MTRRYRASSLCTLGAFDAVILPLEVTPLSLSGPGAVRDGDTMGVAGQVAQLAWVPRRGRCCRPPIRCARVPNRAARLAHGEKACLPKNCNSDRMSGASFSRTSRRNRLREHPRRGELGRQATSASHQARCRRLARSCGRVDGGWSASPRCGGWKDTMRAPGAGSAAMEIMVRPRLEQMS